MSNVRVDPELLLPLATASLQFADTQYPLIKTLGALISSVEEQRHGSKTPEVAQWVTELRDLREGMAQSQRGIRRQGKKLGKLAKQPVLGDVLRMLDMVIREEAPGTAIHEQLTKARLAVEDGLADKPIPKPSDHV
ncbi:hypothetical protein [Mycobacteroides salmoniphilum]|uniref:Uncharacterized protein n=1 Tax=Mycobacteroides salmoniphilum TaxID=404941 RepID=A0A4R8SZY2_9MYCO|nr:hypothetical protein [Mycobacteroides salmoniphilum]TEA09200.1 hypothetical protein CCUG60884_00190 [Mycobacteroides salmoniphilum]